MKIKPLILTEAVCLLIAVALAGCTFFSPGLKSLTPESAGLSWKECPISEALDGMQVQSCFGQPAPSPSESEKGNRGTRFGMENLALPIGQDSYQTQWDGSFLTLERFDLYHNGEMIHTLYGNFITHSPNISLQAIGGKAAWEFSDGTRATVIYDDVDLRYLYGLDKAFAPYALDNRLIFIGQKGQHYFVVFDGARVGPEFDQIIIAYCCETVLYSAHGGQGRFLFWGTREGQQYIVKVEKSN